MYRFCLFYCIVLITNTLLFSQQRNSEVKILLEQSKNDSTYSLEERIIYGQKAFRLLSAQGTLETQHCSEQLASLYQEAEQYDSLNKYAQISLQIAHQRNDKLGVGRVHSILGSYFYEKNESDTLAYYHFQQAQKVLSLTKDSAAIIKNLLRIAILEKNSRDFLHSKESSFRALEYNPKDKRLLSSIYNNLGIVYDELGDLKRAIMYHSKSYELRKELQIVNLEIQSLNNIATAYKDHHQYPKARLYYKKAFDYGRSLLEKYPREYARIIDNQAHLNLLEGKKEVLNDFQQALQIRKKEEDEAGIIINELHLGEYYLQFDSIEQAVQMAENAYATALDTHNYRDALSGLKLLQQCYQKKGDPEKALLYAQKYAALLEQIHDDELKINEKYADIRYNSKQLKKDNALLAQRNILQIQYKWAGIGTAVVLFLLLMFSFLWMRQKIKNKKLEYRQKEQRYNQDIFTLMSDNQQKLKEGQERERNRIQKELHDGIINELYGIRIAMEGLNNDENPETNRLRKKYIQRINDIENQIKDMVNDLDLSLDSSNAFLTMLHTFFKEKEIFLIRSIHNSESVQWEKISSAVKINIYRIIQETFHNTVKYSKAQVYQLQFTSDEKMLKIEISDDGTGSTHLHSLSGMGIKNIRQRVSDLGGTVTIRNAYNTGVFYEIYIPI